MSEPIAYATPARRAELALMPYREYLASPEWAQVRHFAHSRDGHACVVCGSAEALNVHHRTYDRRGGEWPADVVTLCKECHERHHSPGPDDATRTEFLLGQACLWLLRFALYDPRFAPSLLSSLGPTASLQSNQLARAVALLIASPSNYIDRQLAASVVAALGSLEPLPSDAEALRKAFKWPRHQYLGLDRSAL